MNERLPARPLLHSPESDSKSGGGRPSGEKTGFFHAPPRPGDLQKIETGKIDSTAPKNDPTVSLLETLQAVKDKQHGGGSAARQEVSDIAGVQAEKSPLERLMSAQSVVFGATGLLLVLSIWGLIHLANRATETIPASETLKRNEQAAAQAQQAEQETQTPGQAGTVAQPAAPISRPTFKSQPSVPALVNPALHQQNAAAIQAEKERLAREEQERAQREKQREEEDRQERERQLRELEGRSNGEAPAEAPNPPAETPPAQGSGDGSNPQPPPENQ